LAARRINENVPLDFPETLAIGYAQTKWVADAMLLRARARGFTVSIFRPPWIVGHEESTPSGDFVARFLQGCRRIGAVPKSSYRWDLVPPDFVAKAIVALTLAEKGRKAVYHLGAARRVSVPQLVSRMRRLGWKISIVPVEEWRARLRAALAVDAENPLRPVAGLFLSTENGAAADAYLLGQVPEMDSRRTRTRLRNLGVDGPHFSDTLFASLLGARRSAAQLDADR
jgi:thioester reductase-like protein